METYLTPWGILDLAELIEQAQAEPDPAQAKQMYDYYDRLRESRLASEDLERSKRRPCRGGCGNTEYYCLCQ